jgi:hypothetical protein
LTKAKTNQEQGKTMIISDLEHLEVVSEASSVVGGTGKDKHGKKKVIKVVIEIKKPEALKLTPSAVANADAEAVAAGKVTETRTETNAEAAAGVGASSSSSSFASSKG